MATPLPSTPPHTRVVLISKSIRTFFPFALAVSIAAAVANSLTEMSVHHWYLRLTKPDWALPPQTLSMVGTVCYALMALSAWLVYKKSGDWMTAQKPLLLWGIQLILNALWPGFFFAIRNVRLGAIEIIVLLGFVVAATVSFFRRDRTAGWFMSLYGLWTTYVAALTLAIWHQNY